MKVIVPALITGIAALVLVGCQPSASPAPSTSATGGTTPTAAKKYKIAVSIPAADHGWTGGVVWWAEQAKAKHPDVEFLIQTAKTPEEQVKQMETLATQAPNAMVVLATESAPVTPAAQKVKDAGIFLVSVDRGFTKPIADIFIAGDNEGFGKMAAEYMVKRLNGQGKIVILEGLPSTVNTARVGAANQIFAMNPGIQILDSQPGEWNKEKAYKVAQTLLLKHPQIDAIWASDDDMALGVEKALQEAGRTNVWMVGGGGMKDVVKRIMDKNAMFPATVTYSPKMVADAIDKAVEALKAGRKSGPVQEQITIPVELITPENASKFYFPDSVY